MASALLLDFVDLPLLGLLTLLLLAVLNLLRICLDRLVELDFRYLSWTAALIFDLIDEKDDKLLYCCDSIASVLLSSLLLPLPKMEIDFRYKFFNGSTSKRMENKTVFLSQEQRRFQKYAVDTSL